MNTYLIKKVLYKGCYSNIVKVSMNKKQLGEEFKPCYCIVTISYSLSPFLAHDSYNIWETKTKDRLNMIKMNCCYLKKNNIHVHISNLHLKM